MPMTRGMEAACYVKLANGATVADLRAALEASGSTSALRGWAAGIGWMRWIGLGCRR